MSSQAKGGVKERVVEKSKVKEPRLWKVLFLNDDVTPMEFVTSVIKTIFDKGHDEARKITLEIHHGVSSVVGIYPKSMAEAKKMQADAMSKARSHPLTIKLERE